MSKELKETAANYIVGDKHCIFFSGEAKWMRKIKRWVQDFPNDVNVTSESDEAIVVTIPISWFKISPKKRSSRSPEQIQRSTEALALWRTKQKGEKV